MRPPTAILRGSHNIKLRLYPDLVTPPTVPRRKTDFASRPPTQFHRLILCTPRRASQARSATHLGLSRPVCGSGVIAKSASCPAVVVQLRITVAVCGSNGVGGMRDPATARSASGPSLSDAGNDT
jgi:hypothetical protein